MEMLDVNKISSAHDLYSGKPAPYAEGYRNGFNTAKSMLKQAIQQLLDEAYKKGYIDGGIAEITK